MYILLIKTSSLGDVIHTLPALTDAYQHYPDFQCDWVVEETFAEIPTWHPAVKRVIPVALRRWRKQLWQTWWGGAWHQFIQDVTQQQYDFVIDAQGLLKSAILTYQAKGLRCGLDYQSAREPLAALAYQRRYHLPKDIHAVTRIRQLFATILAYPRPKHLPNYNIANYFQVTSTHTLPTIIFLHGTTWPTKHWPDRYWSELAQRVTAAGYAIRLPWGTADEYARAKLLTAINPHISIIPKSNLQGLAKELAQAQAVVGVDTGLAHLAAALAIPSVTLYSATQPAWTGTYGPYQQHLQANFPCVPCLRKKCTYHAPATVQPACYQDLSVEKVWQVLQELINKNHNKNQEFKA
jgi:heptosyltransferase-1